jgi:RNase P/RNase MRP subunit POP5
MSDNIATSDSDGIMKPRRKSSKAILLSLILMTMPSLVFLMIC